MSSLYQYQIDGIEKLYNIVTNNPERAAMLCDPPGAGKTPQAIGLLKKLNAKKTVVICPASLKETWRREIIKWSNNDLKPQILNTANDEVDTSANVFIISFSLAGRNAIKLSKYSYDLLIVDESHYLKNATSQVSRVVLVLLWASCRHRLLMTGTPLPNGRAVEAYTTFSRCHHKEFSKWSEFKQAYCIEENTPWGLQYNRSKNLDKLKKKSSYFLVRRTREEVLQQLPGLVRQNIYIKLPQYKIFEAQDGINIEDIIKAVEDGLPLDNEHITTVRRKLGMLKADFILEHIIETLQEVSQVVVFLHHKELFTWLASSLAQKNISYVQISGLTQQRERVEAVDIFQAGKAQVFLASIKAANTGLTLTSASTLIMAEYDWVPSTNEQAEGRIYRVSQKEICRVRYLVAADSLDEKILKVVQRKQLEIAKAVGGD